MKKTLSVLATIAAVALSGQAAQAAKVCKPKLTAQGMYYYTEKKAKESADYRFGLKVASVHGVPWAHVSQAKNKSYACTDGHGDSGKLHNCKLTANPCMTKTTCKGMVTGKGMYYYKKEKALESMRYRWSLAAAAAHGPNFAHYNKAKNKSGNCTYGHGKSGKLWNCVTKALACN